jgi:pyruvate/2-oxoglutarate dehydrogenase complex dihydrolipoamide dehydrogenase (E3) component
MAGQVQSYDVVVLGGTSGGVIAAVQAAKMGKSVILLEGGCSSHT